MKQRFAFHLIIILILGVSSLFSAEKVGTTSFQFLKLAPDARSAAMGGAFVSVVNTANAVFWNPAALRKTPGLDVTFSYIDYFLDMNLSSVALSFPFLGSNTIGLSAMMIDYGEMEVTDVSYQSWNADYTQFNPGLTGEVINPGAKVIGLSLARSITNKFNFGLTAKYIMEDLVRKRGSAVSFDGGLTYQTAWRSVTMAASVRNFGPEVTFINESYPLPETFTFGVSAFLFSPGSALLTQTSSQSLLISYDLTHPRDYDQQHNMGLEYGLMDLFFLRGGYRINYDEEGITFGIGLKFIQFRLDYAYDPFGDILPYIHRFSLGYGLY